MKEVSIVTDGTCDLPLDLIEEYNIHVVPIKVIFGTMAYNLYGDSGDITKEEFYNKLKTCDEMPSTSVPSPNDFRKAYENALSDAKSVIALFISSKLSGTFQSALRIAELFEDEDITLVDTRSAASSLGLLVLHTAKMVKSGSSKKQILDELNKLIPLARIVIVMDTLEYLHKGGRIGPAKKFLGKTLKMKPILILDNGEIKTGGTIRGRDEVIKRVKYMAPFVVKNAITDNIFIWHSRDVETAKEILEIMEEVNEKALEIRIQEAGPIVGTHVGPKSLGFTYIGKYNNDWLIKKK
ncbi:MAG: DegV family protein [Asgard group archaeon]|nr:DegV family protein [Asgard group archaeon]